MKTNYVNSVFFCTAILAMFFFVGACSSGTRIGPSESPPEAEITVRDGQIDEEVSQVNGVNLEAYVGSYEGRKITLMGTTLFYRQEEMPSPAALKQIGEDHFEVVIPPGARVRGTIDGKFPTFQFNRNAAGDIESVSIVNPDQTIQATFTKTG